MFRSIGKRSAGNLWSQSWRRKGRLWWEGFAENEGFKFKFTQPELITQLLKSSVLLCSLHAWPINDFIVQLHCVNIALHCDQR